MLDDEEAFQRRWGRWEAPEPTSIAALLGGAAVRWWIAGGRAARVGAVPRTHVDTDVVVLRSDLPRVRLCLGDWHLWEVGDGAMRPLRDTIPDHVEQLWGRRGADHPWELDLLLHPDADEWVFKKDPRIRLPWDAAVHEVDGIRWLRPEIALLHKAHLDRTKDRDDLAAAMLSPEARGWLAGALTTYGHTAWITDGLLT